MKITRLKRLTAVLLSMVFAVSSIPFGTYAAEEKQYISVEGNIEGNFRVLERGDELLFSAGDLAKITGFSYEEENGQIVLSRGAKDVRIDPKKAKMYLLEGTGADVERKLQTKPVEEDGTWFLPGSEVMPQLNVLMAGTEEGSLYVCRDSISIWDVYEDFDANDYKFDFARACTNMGVETKGTKILAALNNKGVPKITKESNVVELISKRKSGKNVDIAEKNNLGESVTYTDIFENMIREDDSTVESWNTIWKDAKIILEGVKWAAILTGGSGDSKFDLGSVFTFADEMGEYALLAKYAETIVDDKLEMINAVSRSYGGKHHYAKKMREGASSVANIYTKLDTEGALAKLNATLRQMYAEQETEIDISIFSTVMDPYFEEFGISLFAEELKNVDNAVYYEALANCARAAFEDYGMKHGTDCFRHHAMIYTYACEYSWRAMAEYAKRLNSSYADDFEFIADICLEMKGKLYACASSSANDNRGFDEESDVQESTRVKEVFASISKQAGSKPLLSVDSESAEKENQDRPLTNIPVNTGSSDPKAGSNNLNMNYVGDIERDPATCMISDGENLFVSAMMGVEVTGIHRYPLKTASMVGANSTLVYEIPIPEDQMDPTVSLPEYGEPIAMGMYDKENLCVVMPTGERDHNYDTGASNDKVKFVKIPAFDVTYAGGGDVYDTFTMTDCVDRAKLVGEWFYFERDMGSGMHGLFRRSIYTGTEEQIAEHYMGNREGTGLERLTYVLDDTNMIGIRSNNQESEMMVMDIRSGKIETMELEAEGEAAAVHDGYVYYRGEVVDQKLPLYRMKKGVWEPELVLSETKYRYRYNFYQNTMFLLSEDDVFVIPLDSMGKTYKDYEKIRLYTAISMELAPSFPDSGIWIWDGKIWTYSCLKELNSSLKVLGECEGIISQFNAQAAAQETQAAPGVVAPADQQAPSYEFISNIILFNDFMVVLTGVEETAEIVIDACEYIEEMDLYNIEATLTGENGDKGMTAHYMLNCRCVGENEWEVVDFLITNQSSHGV